MGQGLVVPITLRQLEALVRLSESLAKMQLRNDVSEEHVKEAVRLFKASTMDAVRSGLVEGISFTAEQVLYYPDCWDLVENTAMCMSYKNMNPQAFSKHMLAHTLRLKGDTIGRT